MSNAPDASTFDEISVPLAERIVEAIEKLGIDLRKHAWTDSTISGMSPTQQKILAMLATSQGPVLSRDVARHLNLTAATVSEAVNALHTKGLLRKVPDPTDRRATQLVASAKGQKWATKSSGGNLALLEAALSLSAADQEVVFRSLMLMIRQLQKLELIPVDRMCLTCRHFRPNVYPGKPNPHHCQLVDAPFGNRHLRIHCSEHERADPQQVAHANAAFCHAIGEVGLDSE